MNLTASCEEVRIGRMVSELMNVLCKVCGLGYANNSPSNIVCLRILVLFPAVTVYSAEVLATD